MSYTLLTSAIGTIQARDDQQERLEEFTDRVSSGEFHVQIATSIPSACIDGRCGGSVRPNAAGGSNSLVAAEDLVNATSDGYIETYREVAQFLLSKELPIGGHDDEHGDDVKSGCGACDRLADIYRFIAEHGGIVRQVANELGIRVEDELHRRIVANAAVRNDFSSGASIKSELEASGATVDHLRGAHNEVVAVINTQEGTTLDRDALEHVFGENYEAFNVDVWSFQEAAETLHEMNDRLSVQDRIAAMTYYNVATAHVLCGPKMRVVVR